MERFRSFAVTSFAMLGLLSGVALHAALAAPAASGDSKKLVDYGVSQALAWNTERAESAFVSLLSLRRGDPRALNNLGNLSLLKGELAVALSFYDGALKADSGDAGVRLNRSMVYLLMGEDARALAEASRAVALAGGADRVGALVGMRSPAPESTRAAEKKWLSRADLQALLKRASKAVPTDPEKERPAVNVERGQGKRTPNWRSGATRASDDRDSPTLLYWKR